MDLYESNLSFYYVVPLITIRWMSRYFRCRPGYKSFQVTLN